jgi:hypothetical protein
MLFLRFGFAIMAADSTPARKGCHVKNSPAIDRHGALGYVGQSFSF